MSETVLQIGKAVEIKPQLGLSFNEYAELVLKSKSIEYDDSNEPIETLLEECYKEFVMVNGRLFKILKMEQDEGGDIFQASTNPDGTFDFTLQYYNGGCGFSEAFEYAVKKLK